MTNFTIKFSKANLLRFYLPFLLFLFTLIWKLMYVGIRDISFDEPFTIFHAQENIREILLLSSTKEPNPPLFMIILHFWIKVFGINSYFIRFVPILFSALTPVFLYLIGKKLYGVWGGVIASGLFIFSTYHFFIGSDTRAYSMLSFATAASLYYILSITKQPTKIYFTIGLILSNIFLIYSHYFGFFVIFAQFITSLFYLKNKLAFKRIWIAFITTGICFLPMVKPLINRFLKSSEGTWVQPPASSEYIQQLKLFMNSDIGFKILIGALAIGIIITIFFKKNNILWRETIVIFLWWFIPFSIMFLVSQKIPMFTNRYILFNTIGFYLFIGAAITTLYKNIRFLIPIIGITLLVVMFLKLKTQNLAVRETQKSANFIQSKINKNSSIIILPQWANLGFMYYFDRDIFMDHENYNSLLNKNKIFPAWGFQDAQRNIQKHCPGRIIYYQNNSKSVDPTNSILNYLDSAYIRTDSAYFQKGISVTIFEKSVLDSTNNYFN